jgi:CRP/FNR family transcriptional regulator
MKADPIGEPMNNDSSSVCTIADFAACQGRKDAVFGQLSQADIQTLIDAGRCHEYERGEFIYQTGAEPTALYCIIRGKVEIIKVGRSGKEQVIRLAGISDIVGYRSLLTGERHRTAAKVIAQSRICCIPKKTFLELLMKGTGAAIRLMEILSNDLRNAEEKIVEMALRPVPERVAEVLLTLRDTYGVEGDQATINITMTRRELAAIAGVAMETMSRQLQRFRQAGIIELSGQKIRVLDNRALIKAANLTG